jgi:hypothetical protein
MTKRSPELFQQLLRLLSASPIYSRACRELGLANNAIFRWLAESRRAAALNPDGPSEWLFEYQGERKFLHEFVRDCVTASVESIEAASRDRALNGTFSVARFQGKTVFRENPDTFGLDDETMKICGYQDRLLRDENGHPVPEMIWNPPSTDLVAMILAAHSKRYRKQSSVSIDMAARHSGGVLLLAGQQQQPKQVAAPLPVLQIIDAVAEPDLVETNQHDDADMPDDAPLQPDSMHVTEEDNHPAPAPAPAIRRAGISEMERDLLARLAAPLGSPERVRPVQRIPSRDSDDIDPARTGMGHVHAGGTKVS